MNVSADSGKSKARPDLAGGSLAPLARGGARRTNVMALAVSEFAAAACHYPIVFSTGLTLPLVVLGWREGENSFVDAAGRWRRDVYVPVCARHLSPRSGASWQTDGTPEHGESLDARFEETRHFGLWLDANCMLEPQSLRTELSDGHSCELSGFKLVNPARILSLTDTQVLELHRRGWLNLLHLHLQSLENCQRLSGSAARCGSITCPRADGYE